MIQVSKAGVDLTNATTLFEPFPGGQTAALATDVDELLIGSVLGCGKSLLLLMAPTRYLHLKYFNAIILRSTFIELEQGLIKMSQEFYPALGGTYNQSKHVWTFPSGATITFGYLESIADIQRYRGIERQMILYDELSSFSEEVYMMMNLWLRTPHEGYPLKVMATSNPGGRYGDWVFSRWQHWVDATLPHRLASGQVARVRGKTRCCILLKPEDNPKIDRVRYEQQFDGLPIHIVKQLKEGDWNARASQANYFKRERFPIIPVAPVGQCVRAWDIAASEGRGDWTVGTKLSQRGGQYCVEDVVRKQLNPDGVDKLILHYAHLDGNRCKIILPCDPGAAGKAQIMYWSRLLNGFNFEFVRDHKKKHERALPVSSQSLAGNISVVNAEWCKQWFDELEAFGDDPKQYKHDDCIDSLSSAYNALLTQRVQFRRINEDAEEGSLAKRSI